MLRPVVMVFCVGATVVFEVTVNVEFDLLVFVMFFVVDPPNRTEVEPMGSAVDMVLVSIT